MLSLEGQPCRHHGDEITSHFDWDETPTRSPGESVQEAGSELEEEQKGQDRQRYRSVPQALHYHLYWTWTL